MPRLSSLRARRSNDALRLSTIAQKFLWPLLAILAVVGIAISAISFRPEKPVLGLISSLPLILPEGDVAAVLGGKSEPNAVYSALQESYTVRPLDTVEQLQPADDLDIVLIAQPRAMLPQQYVLLDTWVREGGRLLLMIDPMLEWPSAYGLGDPRRPETVALLSPILKHWGLEFRYDGSNDRQFSARRGEKLALTSVGHFATIGNARNCAADIQAVLMVCRVGRGQVLLFGDADILRSADAPDSTEWRFVESLLERGQVLK